MEKNYQSIKGLPIVIIDLCNKFQTCLLLMDEPSIVAMFVKLCIYGRNRASDMLRFRTPRLFKSDIFRALNLLDLVL